MSKNHVKDHSEENEEEELNPVQENEENVETSSDDNSREAELESVKNALDEQKDKYIRLLADFDNYKRRTSREMIDIRLTASKDVIESLLVVLDDMDRAEEQMGKSESDPHLVEGTLLIYNKLRRILEAKGLKTFETLHTDFDVEKDEAISEMHVDDKKLKGKVVAEVQKGYSLNEKLIRYAKVVVGK